MRVAHRSRPHAAETANGDRAFSFATGDVAWFGIIDALGHGPRAEEVAVRLLEVMQGLPPSANVAAAFAAGAAALRGGRGAAMTAVRVTPDEVEAAGVGNVSLRAVGFDVPFVSTAGVLGAVQRPLRVAKSARPVRGRIVLFSDGISSRFPTDSLDRDDPDAACVTLLRTHGVSHDDATILIADF